MNIIFIPLSTIVVVACDMVYCTIHVCALPIYNVIVTTISCFRLSEWCDLMLVFGIGWARASAIPSE